MDMSKHWNCPPHNSQVPVAPGCLLLGRQSGEMTPPTIVSVLEPGQLHVALPIPEQQGWNKLGVPTEWGRPTSAPQKSSRCSIYFGGSIVYLFLEAPKWKEGLLHGERS